MSGRLEGKAAIVTGGTGGVGRAVTEKFVREGAKVAVVARNREALSEMMQDIFSLGGDGMALATDVSDEQEVIGMVEKAAKVFGKIDILVNSAAVPDPTAALVDLKLDDWNRIFAVDLVGTMLCCRETVRFMIPCKCGSIVNIGAEGGRAGDGRGGYPMRAGYCSAKMGVIGLTETLSREVGKDGIRVNCVSPAGVNGERFRTVVIQGRATALGISYEEALADELSKYSLGRVVEPEEIANMVAFLASDEASGITGQTIPVNCGLHW
jgi:NAD(P)-dependent dehydrogenase (short-subunit alcohol dehydrogenase family)